jgi:hypothetical protein
MGNRGSWLIPQRLANPSGLHNERKGTKVFERSPDLAASLGQRKSSEHPKSGLPRSYFRVQVQGLFEMVVLFGNLRNIESDDSPS